MPVAKMEAFLRVAREVANAAGKATNAAAAKAVEKATTLAPAVGGVTTASNSTAAGNTGIYKMKDMILGEIEKCKLQICELNLSMNLFGFFS